MKKYKNSKKTRN